MNGKAKKLWVDALHSGDFPQIKRRMHTEHGYDAAGVLCALAHQQGVVDRSETRIVEPGAPDEEETLVYSYDSHNFSIPDRVEEWAGISGGYFLIEYKGEKHTVYSLNDECDLSFHEIADLINAQF